MIFSRFIDPKTQYIYLDLLMLKAVGLNIAKSYEIAPFVRVHLLDRGTPCCCIS